MEMREVIRPAGIIRRERFRVAIRGLCRVVVLGGVEQHAVLAKRDAEIAPGRRGGREHLRDGRIPLPDLGLDRRIHTGQLR
jgi:hypothetical protein